MSRAPSAVGLSVAAVAALWMVSRSPVAPFPLAEAERVVRAGAPASAVDHLDAVARWHPSARTRRAAQERAAALLATELREPAQAAERLRRVLDRAEVEGADAARVWSALGHVLRAGMGDNEGAGDAFLAAYEVDRHAPDAAARLISAARSLDAAGLPDRAYQVWERLSRRHPERRAMARLEQAAVLLARGKVEAAMDRYEDARVAAMPTDTGPGNPELLEVAKLGVATCLERQGLVEEALTELDGTLDPSVLAPRREALEAREVP